MTPTFKRIIGAAGATALLAGAALVAAPAAQADGAYYCAWTLTAVKFLWMSVPCDGEPGDKDSCSRGQTLQLKSNYRYSSTIKDLDTTLPKGKGSFNTVQVNGSKSTMVVFSGDANPDALRGWQMNVQGTSSGAPNKMTLSYETGLGVYKMIFRRDGK